MRHRRLIIAALSVVLASVATSVADANVYCVATTANPACVPEITLQAALTDALNHPGPDSVRLGPGTYSDPAGFSFLGDTTNPVAIQGAGPATVLTDGSATSGNSVLTLGVNSSVSDLHITLPAITTVTGLTLQGAGATRVTIDDAIGSTQTETGVSLVGPSPSFAAGSVTLVDTAGGLGISSSGVTGTARISDTSVTTAGLGISALSNSGLTLVQRSSTSNPIEGVISEEATLRIEDSVIRTAGGGRGLYAFEGAVVAVSDTVISTMPSTIGASAFTFHASSHASLTLVDTIIPGMIFRQGPSTATADVTTRYSDYDPGLAYDFGPGVRDEGSTPTDPATGHNVNVDPGYVSATDPHLAATSPLVDAGDPAALGPGESATAFDGAARVLDGNGDGAAVRDIGAYERLVPPPVLAPPTAPVAPAPLPLVPAAPKPALPAIRLRAHTLTINRTTGKGTISASCTAPRGDRCSVTGTVTGTLPAPKKHRRAARKPVTLATVRATISAGATGKLTISLTKAARAAALKGALHCKLTATVTDRAGGRAQLGSQTLTVKAAAKPKRRHRAGR